MYFYFIFKMDYKILQPYIKKKTRSNIITKNIYLPSIQNYRNLTQSCTHKSNNKKKINL